MAMNEFALIRRYFDGLTAVGDGVALGIGDDCALLEPPAGAQLAISTDTLIAGRHFPLDTAPSDIGWKALAVNLSDLAAMGAAPLAFTLALSLPQADEHWLEAFSAGLGACARTYGIALIGGDTTRGALSLTISVIGHLPAGAALRRGGARPGDLVCVTGTLGDAALGLRLGTAADDTDASFLRDRLDRPTPRLAAGLALRGIASAGIDLSDGLLGDLGHVLDASGVGADIEVRRLPQSPAFRRTATADAGLALQLAGGDDYELCLCIPADRLAAAQAACGMVPLTPVGQISAEPGLRLVDANGLLISTAAFEAYRHF